MTEQLRGRRIGVLGLARSGLAAARLALAGGATVYASDVSDTTDTRAAAARIRELGGEAETGRHDADRLARADRIVISPGIPPGVPILRHAELRDVPVVSELEFAFRSLDAPVIAVTGTNGKTTVTGLISHLLCSAGMDAPAGGNIGLALSEIALRDRSPDWAVVEASSFQLGRIETFRPEIGVLTNLSPDHLDRYDSLDAYYGDKARMFENATASSVWVLNGEDEEVAAMAHGRPGRKLWFRVGSELSGDEEGGFLDAEERLVLRIGEERQEILCDASTLPILGRHNVANALASAIVARLAGAPIERVREALPNFPAPAHRMESLGEIDGVLWINDSKATNAAAAAVAIESLDRPIILLLGGKDKGEDLAPLASAVQRGLVRVVLAYGEAGPRMHETIAERGVECEQVDGPFDEVVGRARALAQPGDVVLLAPACSSYDMFADYEDRGDTFRRMAQEVA